LTGLLHGPTASRLIATVIRGGEMAIADGTIECTGKAGRPRRLLASLGVPLLVTIATLLGLELALRLADFRELREGVSERSLSYRYDSELGWAPIPSSTSTVTNARTIHVRHNSLGLRDREFLADGRPTIVFLGDSLVWGLDAEADERFSEILKRRLPDYRIVPAGVSGYGTDQEYLLLRRLWPTLKPAIVVLMFCTQNDREDNTTNIRYEGYHKPYFTITADGELRLEDQPVPASRLQYIKENWWVHHLWLARLANAVYLKIRHPLLYVPDPTERLVDEIQAFVEQHGARFMVGLQNTDLGLVHHLQARSVPFVTFDEADIYPGAAAGGHWTPEGHVLVAERLMALLRDRNAIRTDANGSE
jgi:hypothetical protein